MLFTEIITVYYEGHTEHRNTPRVYNAKYFYVNVDCTDSYKCVLNGRKSLHSSEVLFQNNNIQKPRSK
jgi:hypothetical protein